MRTLPGLGKPENKRNRKSRLRNAWNNLKDFAKMVRHNTVYIDKLRTSHRIGEHNRAANQWQDSYGNGTRSKIQTYGKTNKSTWQEISAVHAKSYNVHKKGEFITILRNYRFLCNKKVMKMSWNATQFLCIFGYSLATDWCKHESFAICKVIFSQYHSSW